MVNIYDLSYQYEVGERKFPVLHHINASFAPDRLIMLTGPSGCGKTTLLALLAGLLSCQQGTIEVFGKKLPHHLDQWSAEYRARQVGIIFQQGHFLPGMDVLENVAASAVIAEKLPWANAFERAEKILQTFGLGKYAHKMPQLLSCGEQQRVIICQALIRPAKLLLCDEPTASLDRNNGIFLMEQFKQLALAPDRVILMVTHDRYLLNYADEIWEMNDGVLAIHTQ